MGFTTPQRHSDMSDPNTSETPATPPQKMDKKALAARTRVQNMAFQPTPSQQRPIPKDATQGQTLEDDLRRDSANVTVPSPVDVAPTDMPPLELDFLWLSLAFVERPPHSAVCRLCKGEFAPRFRKEGAGIKILGCGRYSHVACFEEKTECAHAFDLVRQAKKTGDEDCQVCASFWAQVHSLDADVVEKRLERWEDNKFPWRRTLRRDRDVCLGLRRLK
ncbi:hypothetical protein CC80DRAFT_192924 [Byssothecium circinans]|uniref:Uncharacterized protein n=1 Tax=Byssothecium circinans TaxID=147558 RepID=A0A6A5THU7_9PLEO|nr:hypothetical protein CC80DRAFT_192924 [Byssothecium circinans]